MTGLDPAQPPPLSEEDQRAYDQIRGFIALDDVFGKPRAAGAPPMSEVVAGKDEMPNHVETLKAGALTAVDVAGSFAEGALDQVQGFAVGAFNLGKEALADVVRGVSPALAERIREPVPTVPARELVAQAGAALGDPALTFRALAGDEEAAVQLLERSRETLEESTAIIEGQQRRLGGEGLVEGAKTAKAVAEGAGGAVAFMKGPSGQFAGLVQKFVGGKVGARLGPMIERALGSEKVARALAGITGAAAGFGAEGFVRGGPEGREAEAKAGAIVGPVILGIGKLANATESAAGRLLRRYFDGEAKWSPQVAGAIAGLLEGPAIAATGGLNTLDAEFWRDGLASAWNGDEEAFREWLVHAAGTTAATMLVRGARPGLGQEWARMNPEAASKDRMASFDREVARLEKARPEGEEQPSGRPVPTTRAEQPPVAAERGPAREAVQRASSHGWRPAYDRATGETTLRLPGLKGRLRMGRGDSGEEYLRIPRDLARRIFEEPEIGADVRVEGEMPIRTTLDLISARTGLSNAQSRRHFGGRELVEEEPGVYAVPDGRRVAARFGRVVERSSEQRAWKGRKRKPESKRWTVREGQLREGQPNELFEPIAAELAQHVEALSRSADPTARRLGSLLDGLAAEALQVRSTDPVAQEVAQFWSLAAPHQILASRQLPAIAKMLREASSVAGGSSGAGAAVKSLGTLPRELKEEAQASAARRARNEGSPGESGRLAGGEGPLSSEEVASFQRSFKTEESVAKRGEILRAYTTARIERGQPTEASHLQDAFGVSAPTARSHLEQAYVGQPFAGSLYHPAVVRATKDVVLGGSLDLGLRGLKWYAQDLVHRVREQAGEFGHEVAEQAEQAIHLQKEAAGSLSRDVVKVQKIAGAARVSKSARRAQDEASALEWVEPGVEGVPRYAWGAFPEMVEGRIEPATSGARDMRDGYRKVAHKIGKMHEEAGTQILVEEGWIPFTANENRLRFIRAFAPEMVDLVRRGGADLDRVSAAIAHANGIEASTVTRVLRERIDPNLIRRDPVEHARVLERMPAAVDLGGVGNVVRVLEFDPYNAVSRLADLGTKRYSFIKVFGQDTSGRERGETMEVIERFAEAGGNPKVMLELVNALNGVPIERPYLDRSSPAGRFLTHVWTPINVLARRFRLSAAFIPNIPESLANTGAYFGYKNMLLALGDMVSNPRQLWLSLSDQGAITRDVAKWTVDKGRAPAEIARILGSIPYAGTKAVNEFNDFWAAATAARFARRLADGKGGARDAEVLRAMDFVEADVSKMIEGKASPELYARIMTKSAAFTQFATAHAAESSRAAHSRWFRGWFAFQQYAMGKARRTGELVSRLREAETARDRWAATRLLGRFMVGSAASGAGSLGLRYLIYFAAPIALYEAATGEDTGEHAGPVEEAGGWGWFAWHALHYATWGGALEAMRRGITDDDEGLGAAVFEHSIPGSLFNHAVRMALSQGPYRNMEGADKAAYFLRSNVPVAAPLRRFLAATGLTEANPALEKALSAYYGYRREESPLQFQTGRSSDEFLTAMKKAVGKLRRGVAPTDETVDQLVREAVGKRGARATAASLRARRIMVGKDWNALTEEQLGQLRERLGEGGWRAIETFDFLLGVLAESVSESGLERELGPFLEQVQAADPAGRQRLWSGFARDELSTAVRAAAAAGSFEGVRARAAELAEVLEGAREDLDPEEFPAGQRIEGLLLRRARSSYRKELRERRR